MVRKPLRWTAVFLAAAMLLSSCGKKDKDSGSKSKGKDSSSAQTAVDTSDIPEPIERKPHTVDPEQPVIAITFDGGPDTEVTPQVLDVLEKYDTVGTFFLLGSCIGEDSEDTVKRAYSLGCDIGNNSFSGANLTTKSVGVVTAEVNDTDSLIYSIIGERPRFFRAPYTYTDTEMFENIDKCFISGFDCGDDTEAASVDKVVKKVMKDAADGAIILMHDSKENTVTAEALDKIIPKLQDKGYQLVTVSELFEVKDRDPESSGYRSRQISNVLN